jgi:hypothetical protein
MVDALQYDHETPPVEPGDQHTDEVGQHIPSTHDESPKIEDVKEPTEYKPAPEQTPDPYKDLV